MYQVRKDKCISCQSCVSQCPEGMAMDKDGKVKIIKQEKVEECGGEYLCPVGAIEKME